MPATDDLIFIEIEFQQSADKIIMRLNEPSYGDLRTPFAPPFPDDVLSTRLEAI